MGTETPDARVRLELRALAREIAGDLFTYGASVPADRLVQVVGTPERQLGGWGIGPATDRIYKHLLESFTARRATRAGAASVEHTPDHVLAHGRSDAERLGLDVIPIGGPVDPAEGKRNTKRRKQR